MDNNHKLFLLFSILYFLAIFFFIYLGGGTSPLKENVEETYSPLESKVSQIVNNTNLGETSDHSTVCRHYTQFYQDYFNEFYPEYDIRRVKHLNLTLNDNPHTFLIVAGNKSYCILDQHRYFCLDF